MLIQKKKETRGGKETPASRTRHGFMEVTVRQSGHRGMWELQRSIPQGSWKWVSETFPLGNTWEKRGMQFSVPEDGYMPVKIGRISRMEANIFTIFININI